MSSISGTVKTLLVKNKPSAGDNLDGMLYDVESGLERCPLWGVLSVRTTNEIDQLIVAACRWKETDTDISKLENALSDVWMSWIVYEDFELHHLKINEADKSMSLIGVTALLQSQLFVTIMITIFYS